MNISCIYHTEGKCYAKKLIYICGINFKHLFSKMNTVQKRNSCYVDYT